MAKAPNVAPGAERVPGPGEPGEREFVGWQRRRSQFWNKKLFGPGEEPSMTEQHHKDSCDINFLLARYERTGEVPRGSDGQLFFGDFSDVPDLLSARMRLAEAQASFMQLPARVRSKFDNDPHKLLQFVQDPKNLGESVELGLLDPSVDERIQAGYDQFKLSREKAAAEQRAAAAAASQAAPAPAPITAPGSPAAEPAGKKAAT